MKNNLKKPLNWFRLDNAAKIFPATSHGSNTGVFRLSCELNEEADAEVLQIALNDVITQYPHMGMILRKGFFWYYLEQTVSKVKVEPETYPPCASLYDGSQSCLLRVTYWRNKINIDVFHVLADGSGAIKFFQSLIQRYLTIKHNDIEVDENGLGSTICSRASDGFQKYYNSKIKKIESENSNLKNVYHIKGMKREDGEMTVIEGVADVRKVLEAAHKFGTTLTIYLTSLLFSAIHDNMYERDKKKSVVLTVPVDLRSYFPTDTTRNFFSTIRIGYNFKNSGADMDGIIKSTAQGFKDELTHEKLEARMNMFSSLEHNFLLRPIPLFVKNPVLRISGDISSMGETAAISNIGKFKLPAELEKYVKGFGVFMSTNAVQLCVCTFGNNLNFGFTSAFENSDVQRCFFKKLVDDGVDIEIRSNEYHKEVDL